MGDSMWYKLKKYINSYSTGKIIQRKRIIEKLCNKSIYYSRIDSNPFYFQSPTVDVYRRYLTAAGFLECVAQAKYKKIKHIPINISLFDVQLMGHKTQEYVTGGK